MTYLWKCTECGAEKEVQCSIDERNTPPYEWCCFKTNWERVITGASIKTGDGFKV